MALSAKERQQRWRDKQKEKGKKTVTIVLTQEIFDILESEKTKQNKKFSEIIEQIILDWHFVINNETNNNPIKQEQEKANNFKKAVEQLISQTDFQALLKGVTHNAKKNNAAKIKDIQETKIDNCGVTDNEQEITRDVTNNKDGVQSNITSNEDKANYSKQEILALINQKKQEGLSFSAIADYLNQHANTLTGKGKWHRQTVTRFYKQSQQEREKINNTNNVIDNKDG